jgi:hypothetical protein
MFSLPVPGARQRSRRQHGSHNDNRRGDHRRQTAHRGHKLAWYMAIHAGSPSVVADQ